MTGITDYAFDDPVTMSAQLIRTVSQAADLVRSNLRSRFSMQGLNTILMLERAVSGSEVEEARVAFCSWATQEGLA
jgi:hypothetical protein